MISTELTPAERAEAEKELDAAIAAGEGEYNGLNENGEMLCGAFLDLGNNP